MKGMLSHIPKINIPLSLNTFVYIITGDTGSLNRKSNNTLINIQH